MGQGVGMVFDYITFAQGTGRYSKQVETYNFHKAASVLAEYGFDCIRLADDWAGADFLAHHRDMEITLSVQLKASLVVDRKLLPYEELYICFPLDKTKGTWYLLKHRTLEEIARKHNPRWFERPLWKEKGLVWSWTATKAVRKALEPYALQSRFGSLGYREVRTGIMKRSKDTGLRAPRPWSVGID